MIRIAMLVSLIALAPPAAAREVVLSFGYGQFSAAKGRDIRMLGIETYTDRRGRFLGAEWALGLAAEVGDRGEYWIGVGPAGRWQLGQGWFVEASVMPGYYDGHSAGTDLGSDLEIRSLLGAGRQVTDRLALSLALAHKSNANVGKRNPGQNSISLRARWSF